MRFLLLFCLSNTLLGLSSEALTVKRIIDGDSIVVTGRCAGVELPFSIRLLYLDAPEMRDGDKDNPHGQAARNHLKRLIKPGDKIHLWTNAKSFQADKHGRVLAIVYTTKKVCVQEYMIKHGYSVYWQRFGKMPHKQHLHWESLEASAKKQKLGLWNTQAEWLTEKSNE